MVKLKIKDLSKVERYCLKNIGPRLFYTHVSSGGQGWIIKKEGYDSVLSIEDDKKGLMAALALSEYIK